MCSQNSRSCHEPLGVKTASHLGWLQGRWSFIGLTLGLTLFTTKRKLACKIYNSDSIWVWSVNDFVVDGSLEKAAQGHRAWGQPWSRAPECEGAEQGVTVSSLTRVSQTASYASQHFDGKKGAQHSSGPESAPSLRSAPGFVLVGNIFIPTVSLLFTNS